MESIRGIGTVALCVAFAVVVFFSCEEKDHKVKKEEKTEEKEPQASVDDSKDKDSSACNASLWDNVYNPSRLEVMDKCMTVTGTIEESNAEEDGDQHMLLKLDPEFKDLINKKNKKKKDGDLVIEAVCVNKITEHKVGDACKGYINHIQLPNVGDRVRVTGSYVLDSHNGWTEIHPISKIEKLK